MALTVSNFFVPELLADAIATGFTGMKALWGTDAAIVNTKMPAGKAEVGTSVKIPYFGNVGEWQDVGTDGTAITGVSLTSTPQTATVKQAANAIERTLWTELAAYAGGDPYEIAAKQIVEGFARRIDTELITAAQDSTGWSALTHDISAIGGGTIDYDAVVNARMKWGDEQDNIALMVVSSKVFGDMYKLKDSTGRPLLTNINEGGLAKFVGIPVGVSDRITPSSSVYTNLLLKKGALVAWINGSPLQLSNNDPYKGTLIDSWHAFFCAHRYNPMPGFSKGGVVRLLTK